MMDSKVAQLIDKGVKVLNPESLYVDDDVDLQRVSGKGVILYPEVRIMGKDTLILPDTTIGREAPVTLDNVFVGRGCSLNGGFFQKAVFVGNNSFGSGAHVRGGTILEDGANAAHTVGLKQTILFPFVTLGSLINFCDCLMTGGTSRKDHSEVGSSFIHFNYTPNQDKATPSMFGNVAKGVMLKDRPIFLGGQGGVVGPCRLAFGSITAAGTILRKDILEPNQLILGGAMKQMAIERKFGIYSNVKQIFTKNILYILELTSLMSWYLHIRAMFLDANFDGDEKNLNLSKELLYGMQITLKSAVDERINRLDDFVKKLFKSKELILYDNGGKITPLVKEHDFAINMWKEFKEVNGFLSAQNILDVVKGSKVEMPPDAFLRAVEDGIKEYGSDYVRVIQSLDEPTSDLGRSWLQSIELIFAKTLEQRE
ncbi:MAG: protein GlmU [Desulfamplus sp.]|nr:protein GlmU [Desulfamplus sp.]